MSLKERAQFAQSVGADYLISLHYNASESHLHYGSEVWIPSVGNYYVEGYKFADTVLKEFREMGLNSRGIKTRVGDGEDEYYGIIRESEQLGINAVIIEHCHIDNNYDSQYYDSDEDLAQFGKADATALAKYFGLSSSRLSVDYSAYQNVNVNVPEKRVYQDTTPPDICNVALAESVKGDGNLEISIEAADIQSELIYYSYSLDGGDSYSDLFVWNDIDGDGIMNVILSGVSVNQANLVVRVYNKYDYYTESNMLTINDINGMGKEEIIGNSDNILYTTGTGTEHGDVWYNTGERIGIGAALIIAGIFITVILVKRFGKHGRI